MSSLHKGVEPCLHLFSRKSIYNKRSPWQSDEGNFALLQNAPKPQLSGQSCIIMLEEEQQQDEQQ